MVAKTLITIILGVIIGYIYFLIMESTIPRDVNCSYISNIWTDIFAFIYGFIIIYFGYSYSNYILVFLGITIIVEHVMQFVSFKLNYHQDQNVIHSPSKKTNGTLSNKEIIEILLRQSARYALAAEQDLSPMIAVLHANYAAGYLWALKDIATEQEIDNIAGKYKLKKLEQYVKKIQDVSTKRVSGTCPEFIGIDSQHTLDIARIAGDL